MFVLLFHATILGAWWNERKGEHVWTSWEARCSGLTLESWVDGLALEGEDTENAFVDATKRFLSDEPLQRFDIQCKLAQGE